MRSNWGMARISLHQCMVYLLGKKLGVILRFFCRFCIQLGCLRLGNDIFNRLLDQMGFDQL